jgi:hypothetical protein
MPGRVLAAACSIGVLVVIFSGAPSLAARPVQKSALVTVVPEGGKPLRALTAKDFTVTEDGAKRDVVDAQLADDPLSVALLIDTTQPPMAAAIPPTQDLRTSAAAFVKAIHEVNADAQISLTEFAGAAVTSVDFTSSVPDLEKAIGRLYPNQQGTAVLLEALADAGKRLVKRPAPRRAIVSVDFNSPEGSAERSMKDAATSIHDSGATLWTVSVRGSANTTPNREDVLNKVTKANGGMRLSSIDASGLTANLNIVAASLTSQYVVTFTRPGEGGVKSTTFGSSTGSKVLLTPFMR